jgi:hypothetical protein
MMNRFPTTNTGDHSCRAYHRAMLGLSLAVLVVALALVDDGDGRLRLPFTTVALPAVCTFRRIFGVDCPGCGLTRAFVALAHGRLAAGWHYHPVGVLLFAGVLAQTPYRLWQLARLARGRGEFRHPLLVGTGSFLIVALFVQWVLKSSGLIHF